MVFSPLSKFIVLLSVQADRENYKHSPLNLRFDKNCIIVILVTTLSLFGENPVWMFECSIGCFCLCRKWKTGLKQNIYNGNVWKDSIHVEGLIS